MSVILYMGRHGETKLNSEEKLRGWIDEPLNATGIQEAKNVARFMEKIPLSRMYASDLDRADHTATIIGKPQGLKPISRQWFRPLNYGDLNGKPLDDIKPTLQKLNDIWKKDPTHPAPNGESFEEFQDRNLSGLHAVMMAASDGDQLMLVAHLRNCILFHAVAKAGGPLQGEAIQTMDGKSWTQSSGSVSKFEYDRGLLLFRGVVFESEQKQKETRVS